MKYDQEVEQLIKITKLKLVNIKLFLFSFVIVFAIASSKYKFNNKIFCNNHRNSFLHTPASTHGIHTNMSPTCQPCLLSQCRIIVFCVLCSGSGPRYILDFHFASPLFCFFYFVSVSCLNRTCQFPLLISLHLGASLVFPLFLP